MLDLLLRFIQEQGGCAELTSVSEHRQRGAAAGMKKAWVNIKSKAGN